MLKSLYPPPYTGPLRCSVEITPDKMPIPSPPSLPMTLISTPPFARSGRRSIASTHIFLIALGSKAKKTKVVNWIAVDRTDVNPFLIGKNGMAAKWTWTNDVPVGQNVSSLSIDNETGSLSDARWFVIKSTWTVPMDRDYSIDNLLDYGFRPSSPLGSYRDFYI